MKLGLWPKLHIHTLSTLGGGQNWAYCSSTGSGSRDMGRFSKLPCLGMKLSGQSPRSCTYGLFLPQSGSKLSLFLLYGQRFLRYGPIFKIAIFGHETWQVSKVPEVAHMLSFYPGGWNWAYFCATGCGFRDMAQFSKLPYLGMKLGKWSKLSSIAGVNATFFTSCRCPDGVCGPACGVRSQLWRTGRSGVHIRHSARRVCKYRSAVWRSRYGWHRTGYGTSGRLTMLPSAGR